MELASLTGIGKNRVEALHAAGIFSLRDLLYAVPQKYRDCSAVTPAAQAGQLAVGGVKGVAEHEQQGGAHRGTDGGTQDRHPDDRRAGAHHREPGDLVRGGAEAVGG